MKKVTCQVATKHFWVYTEPICGVVLVIINVGKTHEADIVIFHNLGGQFDHSNVILEGFWIAVVGMEHNILHLHLLGRGAAHGVTEVVLAAVRVGREVVLAHSDRGQTEASRQLRDAVGRGQNPSSASNIKTSLNKLDSY